MNREQATTGERQPRSAGGAVSVRDRILDRTIFLIGRKGTTDVRVREIAREAGVNVAAVNYYFSSKEQMFEQMSARFLDGYEDVMGLLKAPGVPVEQRLRAWCEIVMRHLADYPGVLAVMERLMAAEPLDPFGRALQAAMTRALCDLREVLAEYVGRDDDERLSFKLTILTSAIAGPVPCLAATGDAPQRRGLANYADRERFIGLLLEHLRR